MNESSDELREYSQRESLLYRKALELYQHAKDSGAPAETVAALSDDAEEARARMQRAIAAFQNARILSSSVTVHE
jgi:hypothetical protein